MDWIVVSATGTRAAPSSPAAAPGPRSKLGHPRAHYDFDMTSRRATHRAALLSGTAAAMLAAASPEQQKQMLGERLYMLIIPTQPQLAGKITGMLLEGLDTAELLGLIDSPLALDEKIKLALEALQKHSKA